MFCNTARKYKIIILQEANLKSEKTVREDKACIDSRIESRAAIQRRLDRYICIDAVQLSIRVRSNRARPAIFFNGA